MDFSRYILFTGAGFTKNFGGLLANEMWSKTFNDPRIQSHSRLRELLLHDFDYESTYNKVVSGDYTEKEKETINNVIFDAYHTIDKIVTEWNFTSGSPNPVNIYRVNKLIERFSGQTPDMAGFFFTLNQDLFIERHFSSSMEGLVHPGIRRIPDAHKIISKIPLERNDFIELPTKNELATNKNLNSPRIIYYIKLHGSFGWLSASGANAYVIGREKDTQIIAEPLLSWYFDLFKEALSAKEKKLLLIGYSFKDKHINNVIANSVAQSGLRLFVISPLEQHKFVKQLLEKENGDILLSALTGYFPYRLLDIFPQDQSETHAWREIIRSYFVG
jgi:SIR2-like domain